MPQRLQLQRTFSLAKDVEDATRDRQDFDYARYWRPNGPHTSVFWEQLLERPVCVVLGEAGIGKTSEFEDRTLRLQEEGKSAFFVPLNIALDKDSLSDRLAEPPRSLTTWQVDLDVGYFFLDAVDEARLANHTDLEKALRNVVRMIKTSDEAIARARFMLSSRISDWYTPAVPDIVQNVICEALPPPTKETDDGAKDAAIKPQVYCLDPMSPADAQALARFYMVADTDVFWEAVERQGYEFMATVPLDLKRMCEFWKQHSRFGGLTEMLESSIETRLQEHSPSHQTRGNGLSLKDMREGAELIAAVCSLSGRTFIASPDHRSVSPVNTVSVSEILANWTPQQTKTLLSTAVFDEASYGRVRFHHRTARDYLAAKWISRRMHEGWPLKDVLSLFLKDPFGDGPVAVESRQPVLAWLASMEPKVREHVITLCPDTVFSGGDPKTWSATDVEQALRAFVQLPFEVLGARAASLDVGTLTRIGRRAGGKVLTSFLEGRTAHAESPGGIYLATHLLLIVRYAMLKDCAQAAFDLYTSSNTGPMLKRHVLATLAVVATDEQRQDVRKDLLEGRITTNALRAQACRVLFPGHLSAQELMDVLAAADPEPQANGFLSQYMRGDVLPVKDVGYLMSFLDALLAKLHTPNQAPDRPWFAWLVPEVFVYALLKQEEDKGPPVVFYRAMLHLNADFRASPLWYQTLRAGLQKRIDEFLAEHPQLRRALAVAFAGSHPGDARSLGLNAGSGVVKLLAEDDLSWACQLACDGTLPQEQRRAAFALLMAATRACPARERRVLVKRAIACCDSHERCTAWGNELKSMRFMAKHKRREARGQREQMSERERRRAGIRKYLEENEDGIRRGDDLNRLVFVMNHYIKPFHSGGLGDISGNTFRGDYGQGLWATVKEGFRQFWRKTDAPLRVDVPLNQVPDSALVGLVGIALDIEDGYDVASEKGDAARLARYAIWNISGPSAWFERLFVAYPDIVAEAIWADVQADVMSPPMDNRRAAGLDLVAQGPGTLKTEMVPRLKSLLEAAERADSAITDARYRQILEIIRDAGVEGEKYFEGRVGPLLDAHARGGDWQGVGYWLWFLLTAAPGRAWAQVETLWNSGTERSETDAVRLACGLGGASGAVMGAFPALNFLPDTPGMAPVIEKMYTFFHAHIGTGNDIRHRSGVAYSPGERDIAQSVRDNLAAHLVRILGRAAHESLRRLAGTVKGSAQEAGFLIFLHSHASEEATRRAFLEPRAIPGLGDVYCRDPRSEAELFEVVLARLEAIKEGVEAGPFSDRVLFGPHMAETKLQIWLAARLAEACGRHGFGVTREPEVDKGKKPDVYIHHAVGTVCLEIKPLDSKRYSPKGLKEALEDQLVGQYMGRRNSHHGVLALFLLTKNRRWRGLPGKGKKDFAALLVFLQEYANTLAATRRDVEALKVVGIDCTDHRVPEGVCEETGRSGRTQGNGPRARDADGTFRPAGKQKTRQRRK